MTAHFIIENGSSPSSAPMFYVAGDRITQSWSAREEDAKVFENEIDAKTFADGLHIGHDGRKKIGLLPHRVRRLTEEDDC